MVLKVNNCSPLISIYIPTHNRSRLLKRAITSVVTQTYKHIEILIVNDGSSDDTNKVVRDFQKKFENIRLFENQEAKGACHARNVAIRNARGEFITGLDDDDEFLPDHLETLLDSFCKNDCSFVASSIWEDTGKGRFCRTGDVGEIDLIRALHSNPIGNQIFTRTEWLIALGGFDESLPASQDYDMWIRFIEAYGKGVKLESATYVWHTGHEEKRITNSNVKRLAALDMFFNKHEHLMSKEHIQSFTILRCKADPSHYSLGVMLKNINRWNYKSALSLYVHTRTPALGSLWRRLKLK